MRNGDSQNRGPKVGPPATPREERGKQTRSAEKWAAGDACTENVAYLLLPAKPLRGPKTSRRRRLAQGRAEKCGASPTAYLLDLPLCVASPATHSSLLCFPVGFAGGQFVRSSFRTTSQATYSCLMPAAHPETVFSVFGAAIQATPSCSIQSSFQDNHRSASLDGPNLVDLGPDLVEIGPKLAKVETTSDEFAQFRAKFGR